MLSLFSGVKSLTRRHPKHGILRSWLDHCLRLRRGKAKSKLANEGKELWGKVESQLESYPKQYNGELRSHVAA